MPFQPIETKRLYSQIAAQITELIDAGEFIVGERLPAERDLSARLGVSRSSLREALIALEIEGSIEVRSGSGIFVKQRGKPAAAAATADATNAADAANPATAPRMHAVSPFDVIRARAYLEPEIAIQAVRHASDAQIETVLARLEKLRAGKVGDPQLNEYDRQFHLSLAEASGNSAYVVLLDQLWIHRTTPLYMTLEQHFFSTQWWAESMDEHEEIYAALNERDVRRISLAMGLHMQHAEQRLAGQFK
ncbi:MULTISPECIES: FadR/GntR family transcriptional regulator [Burkholderia]|uniref:FadR family transcriptional regulator n=1 Tax=Burkholderia gladioli TaxID=28095 RepID=A0A2A7SEL9_BURGA|nr:MULTISPECIES: FadR/GntR family transcriptional regulator [Burkholderia]ATF90040.1 GntR family transcriptional regulator [Burkholderia gladioli pv. gladioli]MBJ9660397.1 FadR family transcriptional regulator [Burkholderia gladioli]MBJ9712969.1 FadR family transcriptional regulator [Burkholderia gladioli]MBU9159548.1 FadR family transcriptional regulator [Burkholderia gladioli]MBU9167103.1 FadR family transcriptional regulator [Burkholderia gladioli]